MHEQTIYNYLLRAGLTPAGACGLMGNLQAESGMIPNRVETLCLKRLKEVGKHYTNATYTAFIDDGTISREEFLHPLPGKQYGYGLAQWTSPGRKGALYDFCRRERVSIGDLSAQLEFLVSELKNAYPAVWETLTTTTLVRQASNMVLYNFEQPANPDMLAEERADMGFAFWGKYAEKQEDKGGMISNSGGDERGRISGGKAGDQTGKEWTIRTWYNRPWSCVLRYEKNPAVPDMIGTHAVMAAKNNHIGYNQGNRDSYWRELQKVGYIPSKIKTYCDADCSAGVIANVKAAGHLLHIPALENISATYTGNMRDAFRRAGFTVLTDQKYLTSERYLEYGDILLNDAHHTAVYVGDGSERVNVQPDAEKPQKEDQKPHTDDKLNTEPIWVGKVTADQLNVRTWAGTEYPNIKSWPILKYGNLVDVCDSVKAADDSEWYYVRIAGKYYGFVHSKYIQKV